MTAPITLTAGDMCEIEETLGHWCEVAFVGGGLVSVRRRGRRRVTIVQRRDGEHIDDFVRRVEWRARGWWQRLLHAFD